MPCGRFILHIHSHKTKSSYCDTKFWKELFIDIVFSQRILNGEEIAKGDKI